MLELLIYHRYFLLSLLVAIGYLAAPTLQLILIILMDQMQRSQPRSYLPTKFLALNHLHLALATPYSHDSATLKAQNHKYSLHQLTEFFFPYSNLYTLFTTLND
ncbi:hypothetical protein THIOM_005315 [Candidatus Thiomargarita nelsonii]|uniref:Uncharacterized protein n=1 Tax=Candidatus Thiomargarita nelsonii TaxID=1003181 RepID=A0A176RTI2_9GAMM|nr:hypothetical protein THIOM_005315 [Candidatus Thiomargarita nelsonii]